MYGFFKVEEANLPIRRITTKNCIKNFNGSRETDIPHTDIYLQEFFLSAFSHALTLKKNWIESLEAHTYLPWERAEKLGNKMIKPLFAEKKLKFQMDRFTLEMKKIKDRGNSKGD